jgi:hypothetical protein
VSVRESDRKRVFLPFLLGLVFAVRRLKDLHFNNGTFELNSKRVVNNFHSNHSDESELGAIIRECRNSFSSFFKNL